MAANLTESIGNGMSHAYTIHENTLKIVIPETSQQPVVAVSQPVEVPTEESIGTRSHGVCTSCNAADQAVHDPALPFVTLVAKKIKSGFPDVYAIPLAATRTENKTVQIILLAEYMIDFFVGILQRLQGQCRRSR